MEHNDIQGGELWLPFARSRLKRLRGAGLSAANQNFTMPDGASVAVRIDGEHEFIRIRGGGDLWLLVTASPPLLTTLSADMWLDRDDGGGVPAYPKTITGHTERHTRLYRLPPPYNPKHAVLVYQGSTVQDLTVTPIGTYLSHSLVIGDNAPQSNTFTRTGAIGALTGFVPTGGKVLMWGQEAQHDEATLDGVDLDTTITTRALLLWGAHTQTLEHVNHQKFHHSGVTIITDANSLSGDFLDCPPEALATGQANFRVATQAGTSFVPNTTLAYKRVRFGDAVETDPDGITPIAITTRDSAYTRREVGTMAQSRKTIFEYGGSAFVGYTGNACDRKGNVVRATPAVGYGYIDDARLVALASSQPRLAFSIYDWAGTEGQVIDLTQLPGLADDANFALTPDAGTQQFGISLPFVTRLLWNTAAPSPASSSITTSPGAFAGTTDWTAPVPQFSWLQAVAGANKSFTVRVLQDQAVLWR